MKPTKDELITKYENRYMAAIIVLVFLIIVYLMADGAQSLATREQRVQAWRTEAWNELVANNYRPFVKDGWYVVYLPELDDMKLIEY